MRIGISTSVVQGGKTGIAEYIFSLLRAFRSHAGLHQFILFVLEKDRALFEFAEDVVQVEIVSDQMRSPVRDVFWHQVALPALAKKHRLDVLHVPSYRRLVWRRPCALVGTVHDLAAFHVSHKYDAARMWYGRVGAAMLARRQDELIAVSETTARDMRHLWKVSPERISVIHHGIEHERFSRISRSDAHGACRRRFGLEQPFFLYVARLEHPGKNHLRLIEAFENFKAKNDFSWQLVLAGSDWHGAEIIHEAARQSPARRDIRCLGYVSENDLPNLYRAAKAFLFPSLYEGFGFPPLQAMASGCPVLSSNAGALEEMVGDGGITLDPDDRERWVVEMTRLAGDQAFRSDLEQRGLARARRFNWDHAASATLKVYARAMARYRSQTGGVRSRMDVNSNGALWKSESLQ